MAKLLTLDQMKEVAQTATSFQHLWDQTRNHPQKRRKLLQHFNRLPSEWEDTFMKFLRPDVVADLRRMA